MKAVEGWSSFAVEQCCDILDSMRVPVNAEDRDKRIGEIPYYGANGLQGYIDDFIFDEPLILIAEDGGCFDEFATRPIAYRIKGKSWVNNHAHVLRVKEAFCQDAVFYNLEHKDIQSFIVGGTRSKLNQVALRAITFTLPTSKPEQTKIAEVLSTVDRAIEQTEALIAKQQRIKTGLMQDLLTRGIDEHGNLRSEQTHKFKDSPLGRIPVEWDDPLIENIAVHVGSGVTPRGGEAVYTKEGVLFIRSQNVHFGGLLLSDVSYIPQRIHDTMRRSEVFENDVLLNITGASIGRCCAMTKMNCSANVNQHVCTIRLNQATQSDAGFLTAVIESSIGQNQILQFNAGGNREGLNYQQVRSFVIPWPKAEERQRSHGLIKQAEEALEVSGCNLQKLRSIKTALMQDLLVGKKRVTALVKRK